MKDLHCVLHAHSHAHARARLPLECMLGRTRGRVLHSIAGALHTAMPTATSPKKYKTTTVVTANAVVQGTVTTTTMMQPDAAEPVAVPQGLVCSTWNLAAINNNPFEYWITHDDEAYNKLMDDVQTFIDEPGMYALSSSSPCRVAPPPSPHGTALICAAFPKGEPPHRQGETDIAWGWQGKCGPSSLGSADGR